MRIAYKRIKIFIEKNTLCKCYVISHITKSGFNLIDGSREMSRPSVAWHPVGLQLFMDVICLQQFLSQRLINSRGLIQCPS